MLNKKKSLLTVVLASVSAPALALDPAPVKIADGIEMIPTLKIERKYDDNYQTLNDAQAVDTWMNVLSPSIMLTGTGEKSVYQLSYMLNKQYLSDSGAADLTNHFANANADIEFDARNRLNLNAALTKTETAANAFTPGALNAFTEKKVGAGYVYGAPDATGNVEFAASHATYRSDNGVNLDQERDTDSATATFVYKATEKTRITAEVRISDFNYVSNNALDSKNLAYLVGARWEATAQTTGYAKIGREIKDFDMAGKSNANLTSWEVSADWEPLDYSKVNFMTSQKIDEGSYGADYIDTRTVAATWTHSWTDVMRTNAMINRVEKDYSTGREDDIKTYGVGAEYDLRRWLSLALDVKRVDQASTDSNYDYEQNVYNLGVNVSF